MQTLSYNEARNLWADACGLDVDNLLAPDKGKFNRAFNQGMRRGWEHYWWPELMALEPRFYRPIWTAGAYVTGAEVYNESDETYYVANDTTAASDVPGDSEKWDEIEILDTYVAYEQEGQTGFTHIREAFDSNFRLAPQTAKPLPWAYDERGVHFAGSTVVSPVWLHLRTRCPRWKGADWSASATYHAGKQVYFEDVAGDPDFDGDYFLVLDTTAAAESPLTTPAKFSRIEVPRFLADFAINGAKISFLEGDGQLDKALANQQSDLWQRLGEELDKVMCSPGATVRARAGRG